MKHSEKLYITQTLMEKQAWSLAGRAVSGLGRGMSGAGKVLNQVGTGVSRGGQKLTQRGKPPVVWGERIPRGTTSSQWAKQIADKKALVQQQMAGGQAGGGIGNFLGNTIQKYPMTTGATGALLGAGVYGNDIYEGITGNRPGGGNSVFDQGHKAMFGEQGLWNQYPRMGEQ